MTDYDVVVVGSGAAGLCAAAEAAERGASVLVAESEHVPGGASRFSAGVVMAAGTRFQQERGITDDPDDLLHDYLAFNRWDVEAAVARRLTTEAGPTVEWVADRGVAVADLYFSGDDRVPRGHVMAGGGAAIVDALMSSLRGQPKVDIAFKRRVDRLLRGPDGGVEGVAVGADEVTSGAVVLASGGFGANKELWSRYLPRAVETEWSFYIGPPSSRGDAFALVEPLGAQITGRDRGLINPRPHFSTSMDSYLPGWLVLVDRNGVRFVNEMTAYSVTEWTIRHRGGRVWALFDDAAKRAAVPKSSAASKKYDMPTGSNWEDWVEPVIDEMHAKGIVLSAATPEELAGKMGIDPAALAGTLERYNADVAHGEDVMFEKPARVLRPVSTPPLYATEMRTCNIALTACGPRVNRDANVVDIGTRPIPGLFAAGECAGGIVGDVYMGSGNGLASALTFGRVAGRCAAQQVLGSGAESDR